MKIKTKVKAGGVNLNHSATKSGVKVKSKVRAGVSHSIVSPRDNGG